jgi:hypothetical protein
LIFIHEIFILPDTKNVVCIGVGRREPIAVTII